MERKKRCYKTDDMIREIKNLKGAEVRIFGQKTTLEEKNNNYVVNVIDLLKNLKLYEADLKILCKQNGIKIGRDDFDVERDDINEELINILQDRKIFIEEGNGDNTYNHNGRINHDFTWRTYYCKSNKCYYTAISVHLYGDVRGNYTDTVVYKFEYDTEFVEFVCDYEQEKVYTLKYKGIDYTTEACAFNEGLRISAGYFYTVDLPICYEIEAEDIRKHIEDYIQERNSKVKVGDIIHIYDLRDKEKMKDLQYQNMFDWKVARDIRNFYILENVDNPTLKLRIYRSDLFEVV